MVALAMSSSSPLARIRGRILCAATPSTHTTSRERVQISRRATLRKLMFVSGGLVASTLISHREAKAEDPDLVTEIESEIPAIEEKLPKVPEPERSAVEAELEVVEEEAAEAEERLLKGEETPEDAKTEAKGFQEILDAILSAAGF